MDLSHAVTILESLKFGGMTPMEISDIEQFRFANPRPTYRDVAQILAMLERFALVSREGVGDSTTSNWRSLPAAKHIHSIEALMQAIEYQIGDPAGLNDIDKAILKLLAELGGRIDVPSLRQRLPGGAGLQADDVYQSIAELQAQGLLGLSWGQTEVDFPYVRLSRKGWLTALGHGTSPAGT
ncbi:MAG: hypothetical protein IT204_24245 [Fimbriimonadaceae bacterium]|nr:hypothetical protein [Fimbriimonadaceae bacterium]